MRSPPDAHEVLHADAPPAFAPILDRWLGSQKRHNKIRTQAVEEAWALVDVDHLIPTRQDRPLPTAPPPEEPQPSPTTTVPAEITEPDDTVGAPAPPEPVMQPGQPQTTTVPAEITEPGDTPGAPAPIEPAMQPRLPTTGEGPDTGRVVQPGGPPTVTVPAELDLMAELETLEQERADEMLTVTPMEAAAEDFDFADDDLLLTFGAPSRSLRSARGELPPPQKMTATAPAEITEPGDMAPRAPAAPEPVARAPRRAAPPEVPSIPSTPSVPRALPSVPPASVSPPPSVSPVPSAPSATAAPAPTRLPPAEAAVEQAQPDQWTGSPVQLETILEHVGTSEGWSWDYEGRVVNGHLAEEGVYYDSGGWATGYGEWFKRRGDALTRSREIKRQEDAGASRLDITMQAPTFSRHFRPAKRAVDEGLVTNLQQVQGLFSLSWNAGPGFGNLVVQGMRQMFNLPNPQPGRTPWMKGPWDIIKAIMAFTTNRSGTDIDRLELYNRRAGEMGDLFQIPVSRVLRAVPEEDSIRKRRGARGTMMQAARREILSV